MNATIVNLQTTTFNPTNVDCTTLTADNAIITDITATNATIDNLEATNFVIDTLNATTGNISTINSSTINSCHSNLSTIRTFKINISDAGDSALSGVIRRDANKIFIEGRDGDPTDPAARIFLQPAGEFFGGQVPCIVNASNVEIPNVSSIHLTSTNASIINLSATDIEASGVIEAFSVEASLLNATTNLVTPFVNATAIDTESIDIKRSTGGTAVLDIAGDKLDIDGGFLDAGNVTAKGITLRAGNELVPAIEVRDDNGVTIRNLSCVNYETDNISCDIADITTLNTSQVNASNISTKNLSAVIGVSATFIDATNRMTAPVMNTQLSNVSIQNSSFCNSFSMDTSIIKSKIYELKDASGLGGANGLISETSNVIQIRTGASGGVTKFGTTSGGNFSVQIANDALNASTINTSQLNATDIDATTIDADTITGDIGGNLAAGSGISLSTAAGITTISNTGSVTDPLNLSKLNVSNVSGDNLSMGKASIATTIESAISKSTIFEVVDSSGLGGQPNGSIYETANVMTIRTGAVGGVINFGTTYGGNFSVNIAGDALNTSTANISIANIKTANVSTTNSSTSNTALLNASIVNSDFLNGNIGNNLAAGTNITLSTTGGVTTINSAGGSVSDPLNLSTLNASTGNIALLNTSIINSDFINGNIGNNLAAGTNITLSTSGGVTTINSAGGSVSDPLNVSVVNLSTLNGLTSNISTNNASIFTSNLGYKMAGGASNNTAGGIGSAFGNSAAFGHVTQVLGTNTYAISQTSGGKTFVNCAPTEELGLYHGGSEKITITATEVDIRQPINMSTSNTSTSNALVANISQANISNMSVQNITSNNIYTPVMKAQYQNISFMYYDDVQGLSNPGIIYKAADKLQFWSGSGTTKLVFTTDNTNLSVEVANNELNASVANISTLTATTITGDISPNLTAGTGITLSTTSGVTTINSTGLATSQQYYFRVYGTGSQTVNSGNTLNFTQTTYDVPSGNYDTTNKRYVVPIAGTYQFFFQAFQSGVTPITTAFRLGIYKNGSVQVQTGDKAGNTERAGVILECAAGDLIDVKGAYGTGVVELADSFGWFEGYLLQPENNTITSSTALTTNSLTTSTTNVSNSNISNLTIDNNLNGYAFIRTVAIAKVLGGGTNTKAVGCTVTRTAVGRYSCVLDVARPDSQYVIQLTCMEPSQTLDDVIIQVTDGSMLSNVFTYFIHEQDNSGNPGAYRDRNHFVTVFDTD